MREIIHHQIGSYQWSYLDIGDGPQTILLLPGIMGNIEPLETYSLALAQNFRVIAITIPPVEHLDEFSSGLIELLNYIGVHQLNVFGSSFGGILAQQLLIDCPGLVDRLILFGTSVPSKARATSHQLMLPMLKLFPNSWLRWVFVKKLESVFNMDLSPKDQVKVKHARTRFINSVEQDFKKETYLNRLRWMIDFDKRPETLQKTVKQWPGKVLVLWAEDDPLSHAEPFDRFYENVQKHRFPTGGHLIPILKEREVTNLITEFSDLPLAHALV